MDMSTNLVEVSPLPPGTSIAKVRQVFKPFNTEKIAVNQEKAYVKFMDPEELDTLFMKYGDNQIPQLGNANITTLPINFQWTFDENQNAPPKQMKTVDFLLSEKHEQPKTYIPNPRPIVIAECSPNIVDSISEAEIRNKIFGKYKIGRIIKYKRDIYVEFLDQNEIQTLETVFPGLKVQQLGQSANISPTDPNFSFELVQKQVQQFEKQKREEKRKEEEERQKQQKIKREAAQMSQIKQKLLGEQQRLSGVQKPLPAWNIRPEGFEAQRQQLRESFSNRPHLFWTAAILLWGLYVIFM